MRSTLKNVAEIAGVSFTLVSKYLNGDPAARMTPETRHRIDDALRQLNYRPSAAARTLRSGKSRTVGMICGNLTNSFFAHAADRAMKVFQARGYQLLLALYNPETPESALQMLVERNVDGIYAFFLPQPPRRNATFGIPLLLNHQKNDGCSDFCIAAEKPLTEAFKTLHASRVAGFFVPPTTWSDAFTQACLAAGCEGEAYFLPLDQEARREKMKSICAGSPQVIFSNGWETISCLLELFDDEFPAYAPKILLHANCTGPFLRDPRIAGVITSSTTELVIHSCNSLIDEMEDSTHRVSSHILPARFIPAGTAEYVSLATRHFQLT